MFSNGVTSVVDAGSCGASNYPNHRSYKAQTRMTYKAYINVSPLGLNDAEDLDPAKMDYALLKDLFDECGGELIGLKIRTSRELVREFGFAPLKKTVELADKLGVPVMVRPNGSPEQKTVTGTVLYEPVVTVKGGMIVYRNILC